MALDLPAETVHKVEAVREIRRRGAIKMEKACHAQSSDEKDASDKLFSIYRRACGSTVIFFQLSR